MREKSAKQLNPFPLLYNKRDKNVFNIYIYIYMGNNAINITCKPHLLCALSDDSEPPKTSCFTS